MNLGMFQVHLAQMKDIGTCSVDLRKDVLPVCGPREGSGISTDLDSDPAGLQAIWETDAMVLPLAYVGADSSPYVLAEAAAHLTVRFGVTVDPAVLLRVAELKTRPLAERVATPLKQLMEKPVRWVCEASTAANCLSGDCDAEEAKVAGSLRSIANLHQAALRECMSRTPELDAAPGALTSGPATKAPGASAVMTTPAETAGDGHDQKEANVASLS